jgi:hypothetical protein
MIRSELIGNLFENRSHLLRFVVEASPRDPQ